MHLGSFNIHILVFCEEVINFEHIRNEIAQRNGLRIEVYFRLFADFALAVPSELESVLRLKTVNYFVTRRPWLGM